ncbi:MAG: SUMF1/EgtB/PvdO family nonheme iron enzyme [Spirochaetota bacterium]|nr:SUMF1/EgtB/PvdO family nonheme iron enzyme [Spirochaetota bacterium]
MRRFAGMVFVGLIMFLGMSLVGCGDDGGGSDIPIIPGSTAVTGVSLNKSSTTIGVGLSEQLTATVEPADAADKSVSWSSDNESIATVASDGTVTAIAAGIATITVTTTDGGFTAVCEVMVIPKDMVYVPGGTFQMGYDGVATPVHEVTLSNFYMGKYEVTNAQVVEVFNWANAEGKFVEVNENTVRNTGDSQELLDLDDDDDDEGCHCLIEYIGGTFSVKSGLGDDGNGDSVDLSNYPCVEISWYGAAAFCNYLSEMEGLTPCYDLSDWSCNFSNNGYRLPTEAEWEYAARYIDGISWLPGNHASGDETGYCYPIDGGESTVFGDYAWYYDNSGTTPHSDLWSSRGTHEFSTKAANELGLYDMSGNVYEWCYDWWSSYGSGSDINPTGPISGTDRVLRGGDFTDDSNDLCASNRRDNAPFESSSGFGFRFARTY